MGYDVDYPNAEFHEILPNLFQGGHLWREDLRIRGARYSSVSLDPSWGYVVSACLELDEECFPQCDMRLVLFDDTEKGLSDETWERIRSVVDEVVVRWRRGQKVLIRCQAGYNRSGMLMCLVLMRLGFTAEKAVWQVRWRRGKHVLINQVFERYVREREEEYLDLDAFGATEARMNKLVPVKKIEQ